MASILINIELVEQIATAQNNKRHLHLLYKEDLCVLLSVQLSLRCYVITITYLVSVVTDFLEYHLTEITEKLFSVKLILKVALNTLILTP